MLLVKTLDVGCGDKPQGDVNCDLFIGESPHLRGRHINPKTIPNFVKCTANCLPFRDKAFSKSFCSHVIEHKGVNPVKILREMIRVSRKIVVRVPHRFSKLHKFEQHEKHYNVKNIEALFKKLGLNPRIEITKFRHIPSQFFSLSQFPIEIKIEAVTK